LKIHLRKKIENLLEKEEHKIRYQNMKGFVDNACSELLNKIENEKKNNEK
jgi:hypothetical protein